MKTLKISLLLTVFSLIYFPSTSQVVFGVRGGFNLSDILYNDNTQFYQDHEIGFGGHMGGTIDFVISDFFSIESGLLLTTKGYRSKSTVSTYTTYEYSSTLNLFYFDIPMTPKFRINLGGPLLTLQAGPYIGVGLFGFIVTSSENRGDVKTDSETVDWGDPGFKRLDYGLSTGAGLEINSFVMGIIYNHGVANISSYSGNGYMAQNRVINFTFGYRFSK